MKNLKTVIALLLMIAITGSAIYLIVTDDIMLLNPKMIVSNYQICQKVVSIKETYRDVESDFLCVDSEYIDSNDGYDYYFESYSEPPKYIADYFVKKKDKEIISAFCIQELVPPIKQNEILTVHSFYNNGYIYFTVKGRNSLYRIDDSLKNGSVYFTPQKFGDIEFSSFCIKDNKFYYITDSSDIVEFNGKAETKIGHLPDLESMNLLEPVFRDEIFQWTFPMNNINGVFYFGLDSNLFYIDENGETNCIDLHRSKSDSGESNVYKIVPCKENKNLMAVSYAFFDFNPKCNYYYYRYIINPKTGHYIKFKQRIKNRHSEVAADEIRDYIDCLNSKAGMGGQEQNEKYA